MRHVQQLPSRGDVLRTVDVDARPDVVRVKGMTTLQQGRENGAERLENNG